MTRGRGSALPAASATKSAKRRPEPHRCPAQKAGGDPVSFRNRLRCAAASQSPRWGPSARRRSLLIGPRRELHGHETALPSGRGAGHLSAGRRRPADESRCRAGVRKPRKCRRGSPVRQTACRGVPATTQRSARAFRADPRCSGDIRSAGGRPRGTHPGCRIAPGAAGRKHDTAGRDPCRASRKG